MLWQKCVGLHAGRFLVRSKRTTLGRIAQFVAFLCAVTTIFSNASAQMSVPSSVGCTAANNGDFDFALGAGSGNTTSPFSSEFFQGDVLTFSLISTDVDVGVAEDVTDGVTILDDNSTATADYIIPASGTRDFNLELETSDFDGDITVTCTPASGSITIVKNSDVNGTYSFAGDLGDFMLAVSSSTASQAFTGLAPGSYTVSELVDASTDLSGIACSGDTDSGSVLDVANRAVTIDLDGGEDIQCTFTNTESPVTEAADMAAAVDVAAVSAHAIRNFLYRRANAILSEEPDRPRLIRKTPGVLWEGGVEQLRINASEDNLDADFAASSGPIWGN